MFFSIAFGQNHSTMTDWEQYEEVHGKSQTLYSRAREAMDSGGVDLAIRLFTESTEVDPHFKTLELLGECFLRETNTERQCFHWRFLPD